MCRLTQLIGGLVIYLSASCAIAASVTSSDLWLRESVPGAENGAGFGTLRNPTDQDVIVVAASSSAAKVVELHRHMHKDGQMSMEQVDALTIPAGESVELKPGGYHIMLMQIHEPLQTDDTHTLTLRLDNGEQIEFSVKVEGLL